MRTSCTFSCYRIPHVNLSLLKLLHGTCMIVQLVPRTKEMENRVLNTRFVLLL